MANCTSRSHQDDEYKSRYDSIKRTWKNLIISKYRLSILGYASENQNLDNKFIKKCGQNKRLIALVSPIMIAGMNIVESP